MDNKLADLRLRIEEVTSSMIILQQVLQNNDSVIKKEDIDNFIEILLERIKNTHAIIIEIEKEIQN